MEKNSNCKEYRTPRTSSGPANVETKNLSYKGINVRKKVKRETILITSKQPMALSLVLFYSLPMFGHFQEKLYVNSGG